MALGLTSSEYDEIRLLVGGDLDEMDISDSQIAGSTVLGSAESYVMGRLPSAGLAEGAGYRRAVLYRCAWILVPSFPQQVAEGAGQLSSRYEGASVEARLAFLEGQVETEIEQLAGAVGDGVAGDFEVGFAVFRPNE